MKRRHYDCVILGAGPGGLTAGLYLCRLRRKSLIISSGRPRADRIPVIRNLLGHQDGISGAELLKRLRKQYAQYGGKIIEGRAEVRKGAAGFVVKYRDK